MLDNAEVLAATDPAGMLPAVAGAARQVRASWRAAGESGMTQALTGLRPRTLAVMAAGNAASTLDIVQAVAGPAATVPIVALGGERLPGWVGPLDVVCVASASGRSPETLALAAEAARRGSILVVVAPAGSELAGIATAARGVLVPFDLSVGPARTQVWSLAVPILAAGAAAGVFPLSDETVEATAVGLESVAERSGPLSSLYVNPAKTLAWELSGHLPVVWGSGEVGAAAARRFGTQLAQTAKLPVGGVGLSTAASNDVAALDGAYGALAGRGGDQDFFRDREDETDSVRMRLVLVRDAVEAAYTAAAARGAEDIAAGRNIAVSTVRAGEGELEGASPLERLAYLIGTLDFASVYVALGAGLDPSAGAAISEMRERTAW